jgi:hypothetical protein
VAGKMSETFLLLQDPQNKSNLGISELQQMNWLANVMVEKGLLYTTAPSIHHQTIIQEDYHPLTEAKTMKDGSRNKPKSKLSIQNDMAINHYWWRKKYNHQLNHGTPKNPLWTKAFFDPEEDTYNLKQFDVRFESSVHETNTVTDMRTQTGFKNPNMASESTQPINQNRLTAILNAADVQWNDYVRSDNQDLVSHLIFDACGKAFNVLIRNRPLLEFLVYELLINHQITGREAKVLAENFLCKQTYFEKIGVVGRLGAIHNKMIRMADLFRFMCCSHTLFTWCINSRLTFPLFYYELMTNTVSATADEIEQVIHLYDESIESSQEFIDTELFYDGTPDSESSNGPEHWDEFDQIDIGHDQANDQAKDPFYDGTLYYEPSYAFETDEEEPIVIEKRNTIDVKTVLEDNIKTIEADLDRIYKVMKAAEKSDEAHEN